MMIRHWFALIVLILTVSASPDSARAEACPYAPPPRLREGDAAVIAPGVDRLNLRALPAVDTGVERLLREGMALTVLSGPSCNGGYNWWRVELENGERGWVAEGDWQAYYVVRLQDVGRKVNPPDLLCILRVGSYCHSL